MGLVQKSFSDIITFSRTSNATRVGPTGVLEYAPHNLLLQSQTFQTTWTSDANRGSITADAAAAPDGTVTADKLVAGSDNFGYRFQNLTIVNSTVYTASAYLKSAELTFGYFEVPGGGITYFNLSTGVISSLGSGATATITSVGNGWYRCSVTFTSNTTSGYVNLGAANASGSQAATSGSGILLWGAQLSVGPYALDYVPTTSAAVYGPRFDYDGSGVTIVEPVSRNLVLYSQEFNNAAWSTSVTAVTANNAIAPDGTLTADTATIQNTGYLVQTYTAPSLLPYVLSVWMRAASSTTVKLGFQSPSDVTSCNVTTTWQRFTHTNVRNGLFYPQIYNDSGSAVTVELWGAQLEVGSTATAYMVSGATNGFRAVPVVSGSATPKGLLVEESRTNLLTYSEDLSNGAWGKTRGSVTANATASPDGTVNADAFIEDTQTGDHYLDRFASVSSGAAYTFSIFAKSNGRNWFAIAFGGATASGSSFFDLANGVLGTVVANASATITNVGNGWYRCTITVTTNSTTLNIYPVIGFSNGTVSYTGNGTSGLYLWGAQLE